METLHEAQSLGNVAKKGESYTVSENITVEYLADRMRIGKLNLNTGDVIDIQSNDPSLGLCFRNTKAQGPIVVSPRQALLMKGQKIE